ncbi:MAG: amidohydrolase family protein [Acidimicrobiales bacterium]
MRHFHELRHFSATEAIAGGAECAPSPDGWSTRRGHHVPHLVVDRGSAAVGEEVRPLARHQHRRKGRPGPEPRAGPRGGPHRRGGLAHCRAWDVGRLLPSSSLKLAKGATAIGKYPELMVAGAAVGLGTDGVSAAANLNLHRQVYPAAGLFKDARLDPGQVGARRALRMATIDGARALGWDREIGSLEPGKQADFVLFDLDHHEWSPYGDPVQAAVWSASAASISQTWVAGRPLFSCGQVAGLEPALRAEARQRAAAVVPGPASAARSHAHGPLSIAGRCLGRPRRSLPPRPYGPSAGEHS